MAFVSSKFVVLYALEHTQTGQGRITQTLAGHKDNVHVVKWPAHDSNELSLVSGSESGEILIWLRVSDTPQPPMFQSSISSSPSSSPTKHNLALAPTPFSVGYGHWEVHDSLKGHSGAIHCVDALRQEEGRMVVVSASSDNTVRLWMSNTLGTFQAIHCLNHAPGFGLAVALTRLPSTDALLLAVAGDDTRIHLYTITGENLSSQQSDISKGDSLHDDHSKAGLPVTSSFLHPLQVKNVANLQGHEDWVRALSFATFADKTVMLASGSQDSYIRLWAIRGNVDNSAHALSGQGKDGESSKKNVGEHGVTATSQSTRPTADVSAAAATDSQDSEPSTPSISFARPLSIAEKAEAHLVQHTFLVSSSSAVSPSNILFPAPRNIVFQVSFDALLVGHDDIVYSTRWHPTLPNPAAVSTELLSSPEPFHQPYILLSASMDKTMIVWQPDKESGIWIESARVGEVGGGTLGFYGGLFGPRGDFIIAHGYQGAFHIWTSSCPSPSAAPPPPSDIKSLTALSRTSWEPVVAISGHFGAVTDLDWASQGEYLLSTSEDQTTRIFAPSAAGVDFAKTRLASSQASVVQDSHSHTLHLQPPANFPSSGGGREWHELARPQVHGYDMQCVASITPTRFVSGADEKVLRVFEAPVTFLDTFRNITGLDLAEETEGKAQSCVITEDAAPKSASRPHAVPGAGPLGASVPALGLSNKAVFLDTLTSMVISNNTTNDRLENAVLPFAPATLAIPPFEEHLLQNTLWPEIRKLYGHGYELLCVAASHDGTVVASACKATKPEHASIRLWSMESWNEVAVLLAHTLSVTQLAFSHNDTWLLSGSRDRQWTLFRRDSSNALLYTLYCAMPKAHERIIWSVSWAIDDAYFVTASRDKFIKLWSQKPGCPSDSSTAVVAGIESTQSQWLLDSVVAQATHSVTAVAVCPLHKHVIAAGLETGDIVVYRCEDASAYTSTPAARVGEAVNKKWTCIITLPPNWAHAADVTRLRWRPSHEPAGHHAVVLASASRDSFIRIFRIYL